MQGLIGGIYGLTVYSIQHTAYNHVQKNENMEDLQEGLQCSDARTKKIQKRRRDSSAICIVSHCKR